MQWWNHNSQTLNYAEYRVGNSTIMVGNRPNLILGGQNSTTPEFYDSIDAWLNVSDTFVEHKPKTTNVFLPWYEMGQPTVELIFSALKHLNYWINDLQLPRIYLHCDLGTHRAVTVLGFYLLSYHSNEAENICANHKLVGREHWSNPLEYAHGYLTDIQAKISLVPCLPEVLDQLPHLTDNSQREIGLSSVFYLIGEDKFQKYYVKRMSQYSWPLLVHLVKNDLYYLLLSWCKIYSKKIKTFFLKGKK